MDCRDTLDKSAPEIRTNFNGEEIRGKFLGKLSDGERPGFVIIEIFAIEIDLPLRKPQTKTLLRIPLHLPLVCSLQIQYLFRMKNPASKFSRSTV